MNFNKEEKIKRLENNENEEEIPCINSNNNEEQQDQSNQTNETSKIDQILDKYGYSYLVWINITCTFLALFVEDIEMTYFAYLLIPYRKKYNLSNFWVIIIHITFSSGCAFAATIAGLLTKYIPRNTLINICFLVILFNHFEASFILDKYSFCFIRLTTGFAVGIVDIVTLTVLSEYLPQKLKAFLLTFIWIAFTISPTIFLWIMLRIMPNLEPWKIKDLMLLTSVFPLVCLLFHFFFFKDSPSSLIMRGENKEGFEILEKMNGKKLTKSEKAIIIKQISQYNQNINDTGVNAETGEIAQNEEASLSSIYTGKYMITTLILSNLWFTSGIVCYGIILVSSLTLKENVETSNDIIKNEMFIRIPSAVSYILGAPLVELTIISRKNLLIIINAVSTLFLFLSVMTTGETFSWMIGVSLAMNFLNLNICNTYVCEIYNDKVRDLAIGALFTGSSIGSILGLIMVPLDSIGKLVPYYLSICLYGVSTLSLFFLPKKVV
jgi:hypothetical protein